MDVEVEGVPRIVVTLTRDEAYALKIACDYYASNRDTSMTIKNVTFALASQLSDLVVDATL